MTTISKWSLTLLLGMTLGLASCGDNSNKNKEQASAEEMTPTALAAAMAAVTWVMSATRDVGFPSGSSWRKGTK